MNQPYFPELPPTGSILVAIDGVEDVIGAKFEVQRHEKRKHYPRMAILESLPTEPCSRFSRLRGQPPIFTWTGSYSLSELCRYMRWPDDAEAAINRRETRPKYASAAAISIAPSAILTDDRWLQLAPIIERLPAPGIGPHSRRAVLQAILHAGCMSAPWSELPSCLPPPGVVAKVFRAWRESGAEKAIPSAIHHACATARHWRSACLRFDVRRDDTVVRAEVLELFEGFDQ